MLTVQISILCLCLTGGLSMILDRSLDGEQNVHSIRKGHESSIRRKRGATNRLWQSTTIPYSIEFDEDLEEWQAENLRKAMDAWEKGTCIKFKPVDECIEGEPCLKIQDGENECKSDIGFVRAFPLREIKLDVRNEKKCFTNLTLVHELGHILGLAHQHSRSDRDKYVTIHWENIHPNHTNNFQIQQTVMDDAIPYDHHSIMHYGAMQHNGEDNKSLTIETKDKAYQNVIGTQSLPSFRDYKTVNMMYKCDENCVVTGCPGEGYQDKECKCKCPVNDGRETALCHDTESPTTLTTPPTTTSIVTTTTIPSTTFTTATTSERTTIGSDPTIDTESPTTLTTPPTTTSIVTTTAIPGTTFTTATTSERTTIESDPTIDCKCKCVCLWKNRRPSTAVCTVQMTAHSYFGEILLSVGRGVMWPRDEVETPIHHFRNKHSGYRCNCFRGKRRNCICRPSC